MKELKLTMELVPSTSWFNNLRKAFPPQYGTINIRIQTYAKYSHRCGICRAKERLNCHEIWEYDDKKHIQKLTGFIALCDLCHHVKHMGRANILAHEGKLGFETVVEHFMKVNRCDRTSFERYRDKASDLWEERSQYEWKVDLGEFDSLVESHG